MPEEEKSAAKLKKAWPTKAAMDQVYAKYLWGSNGSDFYSGIGSHDPSSVDPYINSISSFLKTFKPPLVVCDLGCGDFNVGQKLVPHSKKYIAVDIVEQLITHHKQHFKRADLEFHCLDIAVDKLPAADCAIIRQVLQHLSNAEVQGILKKLSNYKFVILTEHIPQGDFIANKGIISGQGTRLKKQSGLKVLESPFNFRIKKEKEVLSTLSPDGKGVIVTTIYTIF